MPRKFFRTILFTLSCVAAGLAPSCLLAQTAYGVTATQQLVRFDVATPGTINSAVSITGLGAGESILGIDFRPANGQLYALGSLSRLYTINTVTAVATQVGASGGFTLSGSFFGFDFNPTVDRIRVVSDADQNLRLNPSTGALAAVDTNLAYAAGDPLAPANPFVAGSAYTNNFFGATTTTLYAIDAAQDVLAIQNPPNAGALNTVGALGVNASALMGFDILTAGGVDTGYAALQVGGLSGMYRINLATGAATLLGNFPGGTILNALAVQSDSRLVNISTRMQVLTGNNVLIGGFIIGGSTSKTVVIRARGPSLAATGVPGVLANPQLQLFSGQTLIGFNDDWGMAPNSAQVQSSGFAPPNAQESAILVGLAPGPYTAIVSGVGGTTGVGLVEVFEVDAPTASLINIATRGQVLTGDNVMIGGFIIQGTGSKTVVVRARGPSLAATGVPGVLANPVLSLFRSSDNAIIASNDDWQTAANAAELTASGFAPSDPLEAAVLVTLQPGAYTAIVTGAGFVTGVGIVEVFATN